MPLIDTNIPLRAGQAVPDAGGALAQGLNTAATLTNLVQTARARARTERVRGTLAGMAQDPEGTIAQLFAQGDGDAAMETASWYSQEQERQQERQANEDKARIDKLQRLLPLVREANEAYDSAATGELETPFGSKEAQARYRANEVWRKNLPQAVKILGLDPDRLREQGVPEVYDRDSMRGMEVSLGQAATQFRVLSQAEAQAQGYAKGTVVQQQSASGEQKVLQEPDAATQVKGQTDLGKLTADYRAGLLGPTVAENEAAYQKALSAADLGVLPPKELAKLAEQQGDNYFQASKDFLTVQDAYARIQASVTEPSAAGDLSLIFNYMKMLDPGSVVRESEFATAAAAGSYGERIQGFIKSIQTGERLSPAQRADFVQRSGGLMRASQQLQEQRKTNFTRIAKRAGIDPLNVIDRVIMAERQAQAAPQLGPPAGGQAAPQAAGGPQPEQSAAQNALPQYASVTDVQAAIQAGRLKPGDRFIDTNGVPRVVP